MDIGLFYLKDVVDVLFPKAFGCWRGFRDWRPPEVAFYGSFTFDYGHDGFLAINVDDVCNGENMKPYSAFV